MPPLPALRCSPGRERITENGHNRGQSFESGLTLKANDDDLVLFNEVQNQERDNFLLHTTDDFEDSLSKLKNFSDFKIGINIPSIGKKSDLLNAEEEKNDYDWLLTPPETPLFTTLDDDDPQPVNPASRDRTRSQPIPISRSLTDKNYQTSRTSYSPLRLSPSPRSSVASAQMKERSLSAPQSSPPPIIRSITPTRRFSTPPNKPSIAATRSSTPTLRKTSTGIPTSNYGGRGPSPVKASRGDSASPKSRGWQTTHSGFNSGAPPNLRTSLSNTPLSHVRGSSPASRNGRESMKLGGKLMSPTSSRSISSSYSQERDHFSSCSKGSMAYSGDDDEEYLHSITVGISRSTPPRTDGISTDNKAMPFSRKPSRTSSNYVPKRSFNSAPRLMEQRRTPQSMFRPLLSSVPASTFRPIFSRNSSLATSSNASSAQGVISVATDVEGGEHEQNDLSGGWERVDDFDCHEEAFLFNKVDDIIRETNDSALCGKHRGHDEDLSKILRKKLNSNDLQNPIRSNGDVATSAVTFKLAHCADSKCDIDGYPIRVVCSKCGREFNIYDAMGNKKLCEACGENSFCSALTSAAFTENEVPSQMDTVVMTLGKEFKLNGGEPEFHKDDNGRIKLNQHGRNIELVDNFLQNTFSMQFLDGSESRLSDQCLDNKNNIHVTEDCRGSTFQSSNHAVYPSLKVDVSENAGILVLLQQGSANTKWPILQGKSLSAANNLCSEPSYSRNNVNALRRSFGLDSSFTSSSIDLGLSKLTETYGQHHLSMNSEALDVERDIESFAGRLISDNDASTNCYEPRHLINEYDGKISRSIECLRYDSSQNLNHKGNNDLSCSSAADIISAEECSSSINNDEDPQNSGSNVQIIERTSNVLAFSELDEDRITVNHTSQNVILDAANDNCCVGTTESHDGYIELEDGQNECTPFHGPPSEEVNEHTSPKVSENGISLCFSDSLVAVLGNGESAIMVEGPRRQQSKNLTLEEATDTILFCSSIIHDLAYKATTVALEKDQETLLENYYAPPIVTIMENPIPGLREKSGKFSSKPMPRSHKFKRKKTEAQAKSPLKELNNENDVNIEEFTASKAEIQWKVDSEKPPKLESKCNCSVM